MLYRSIVAAAFAAISLAGAEYRGPVTSAGLPIPGAVVTATLGDRKEVTSTNEAGVYVFEDLPPGEWTITVEAFGFEPLKQTVSVPGPAAALTLKLAAVSAPAASPARTGPGQGSAFQRVAVNQTAQDEALAALAAQPEPAAEMTQNANESFLVNGSLSRGLQAPRQMDVFAMGPNGMGDAGAAGQDQPGGPGGPPGMGPQADPGGPGMGRGPGMGGGPGMMGGGRMGGGGFGGRGGPGGPGGRGPGAQGRPNWQNRPGTMLFGNRSNRGRETFRGAAFFTLRNSALDARPYSLTGQTVAKPSYDQSRFGFSGGGQLRIPKLIETDKIFFFFNYSGSRSRNPFNATSTLPSPAERAGDFSQSVARGSSTIYDPLSGTPFPNNAIPSFRIDPAASGLLSFVPQPNQPGGVRNYQFLTSVPSNSDMLGTRVFDSVTSKDRIGGGFNFQSRGSQSAQLYQFLDSGQGRSISLDLSWTRTFHPGLISNLHWTFSRNRNQTVPFFAYGQDVAAQLGINGVSSLPVDYGPPNLSFTNFGGLSDASAALTRNQSSGVSESVTLVHGKHNVTLGGQYQRNQLNNHTDQNGRGAFTFSGIATSAFDSNGQPLAGTGLDFADFLLGLPQSSSIQFGSLDTYFRGSLYAFYGQDDWRLRSNLSLNLGLRYEYQTPLTEKYGRIANLDIAPGFTAVAPVTPGVPGPYTGAFPNALVNSDPNNIAPRLGLAWKPYPKRSMTVRAGYGIYFNGSVYNQAASRLAQQPPFASTATLTTSLANTLTIQNGFAASPDATITNSYAVDRNYKIGYGQTWNFSVQQDLPLSLVLELGYLGTKGTRLDIQGIPNRAPPGSPLTAEQRRQIGNATGFLFDSSNGNSIYHAAQVRLNRRFRRGISIIALYTFSKSIDNVSSFGGGGSVVAQDATDLKAERGLSTFDARHTLNLSYVLSSPVGEGPGRVMLRGWAGRLAAGWTLSGGVTARSGSPLTATVLGNRSDAGGTGAAGSSRAEATGLPVLLSGAFFNPAAFMLPPSGQFGNAGRNTIPGPSSVVINIGFGRAFRLGETRRSVELRVDTFNTLNAMNVSSIGATVNSSSYGLALGTSAMRTVQANLRFRF